MSSSPLHGASAPRVTPVRAFVAAVCMAAGIVSGSLVIAPTAYAQETSSQLNGQVQSNGGQPLAGATVTVTHIPSGSSSDFVTNASGQFSATGLRVGGPYKVEVRADNFEPAVLDGAFLRVGEPLVVNVVLKSLGDLQEVIVAGTRQTEQTIGAGSVFTVEDIATLPSIGRDIKDLLRTDSRIFIDRANSDAISVAGANSRYNSLVVDGIRQGDDFGLNNNGYPSARSPISLDAIESFSVKISPFDTFYSNFTGGQISIVTKSGTNEFHGTGFYNENSSDDVWGVNSLGRRSKDRVLTFDFEEKNYGASVGGPIIEDKLFFFANYEKTERTSPVSTGFAGSGFPVEISAITAADVQNVVNIAKSVYNYDAGGLLPSNPEDDEKTLVKLDWNIVDGQRASLTYQRNRGIDVVQANSSSSLRRLSLTSNWYNRPQALDQITFQLFSKWSDAFSTELRIGRKEVDAPQDPFLGKGFSQAEITTPGGGTIYIGPDEFRHSNILTNDLDTVRFQAQYLTGDHKITAGVNLEQLEIFNAFVPYSLGLYRFSSITNFQNRVASYYQYSNATSNNAADGSASFGYDTWAFYLQDRWEVSPTFTLLYGFRYDLYKSDDNPRENPAFVTRYGYTNASSYDGRDIFQPRIGFEWEPLDRAKLRGGIGLFGGGSPNVWVSNGYSNDGVTIVQQTFTRPAGALSATQQAVLDNVDPSKIPAAVLAAHSSLVGTGAVNLIDPNFKMPSSWKANLNWEQKFDLGSFDNIKFTADLIVTEVKDAVVWQNIRYVQTGTAPDGRPIYGLRTGAPSGSDFLLTNTNKGDSVVFSLGLEKSFETRAGDFDLAFNYTNQNVREVNPGTSSTAQSNWDNIAVSDMNNPALTTANTEIEHRGTLRMTWRKALFGDYETSAGLFIDRRSGLPYSYTFRNSTFLGDPRGNSRQRQLFYVPKDATDVIYSGGLTAAAMDAFIAANNLEEYRGRIVPRNAFNSPWVTTADLRLQQQFPVFGNLRGAVVLDIVNLTNLIDSDWGRFEQVGFPYVAPVVDAARDATTGKYIYSPISATNPVPANPVKSINALPSVWRIQLGVRFEF